MKNKDVVIGMKVVPTRKTMFPPLSGSKMWNRAKLSYQPYLYVDSYDVKLNAWVLVFNVNSSVFGDYFKAKDFVEYVG